MAIIFRHALNIGIDSYVSFFPLNNVFVPNASQKHLISKGVTLLIF